MATYVFNTSQEMDTERKRLIIHIKKDPEDSQSRMAL